MTREEYKGLISKAFSGTEAHGIADEYIISLEAKIAELEAELQKKDKELSEIATIAYMQGAGKTQRLREFARKTYDELQELKAGVVAEFEGVGMSATYWLKQNLEKIPASKYIHVTIKEKKQ